MKFFNNKPTSDRLKTNILFTITAEMTRDELRQLAKDFDIPRGRNRQDTINNIFKEKEKFYPFMNNIDIVIS